MEKGISESRFYMWRAVVAMMHADHVIKPHEINFILESTRDVPMDEAQRATLKADLTDAPSIDTMFAGITSPRDREDFFHLARALAWSDGHFDEREEEFLRRLQAAPLVMQMKEIFNQFQQEFMVYAKTGGGDLNNHDPAVLSLIKGLLGRKA